MELSVFKLLIILFVVLLIFGPGRMSKVMGDMARGIKSFKNEMAEDDKPAATTNVTPTPTALPDHTLSVMSEKIAPGTPADKDRIG